MLIVAGYVDIQEQGEVGFKVEPEGHIPNYPIVKSFRFTRNKWDFFVENIEG